MYFFSDSKEKESLRPSVRRNIYQCWNQEKRVAAIGVATGIRAGAEAGEVSSTARPCVYLWNERIPASNSTHRLVERPLWHIRYVSGKREQTMDRQPKKIVWFEWIRFISIGAEYSWRMLKHHSFEEWTNRGHGFGFGVAELLVDVCFCCRYSSLF